MLFRSYNTLNMQAQRNVQYSPEPGIYGPLYRHGHRGTRRVRAPGGIDTRICIGC